MFANTSILPKLYSFLYFHPPRRRFVDWKGTSDRFPTVGGFGDATCGRMAHNCLPYVSHVCYSRQVHVRLRASKLLRRQYVIGWRDSLAFPIVCACCGGPDRRDAFHSRCPRLLRARLVEGVTTPSACQHPRKGRVLRRNGA